MGRWPSHPRRPNSVHRKATRRAVQERLEVVVANDTDVVVMSAFLPKLGGHGGKGGARQSAYRTYMQDMAETAKQLTDTDPTYADALEEQGVVSRLDVGSPQSGTTLDEMPDHGLHATSTREISSALGNLGLHNSEAN